MWSGAFFDRINVKYEGRAFFFIDISVDRFGVTGTLTGYLSGDVDVYGILLIYVLVLFIPSKY